MKSEISSKGEKGGMLWMSLLYKVAIITDFFVCFIV